MNEKKMCQFCGKNMDAFQFICDHCDTDLNGMKHEPAAGREENHWFKLPEPYRDGITSRVEVFLGPWERIRVLFGAVPVVTVKTLVQNPPGKLESEASVMLRPRKPKPGATAEAEIAFIADEA